MLKNASIGAPSRKFTITAPEKQESMAQNQHTKGWFLERAWAPVYKEKQWRIKKKEFIRGLKSEH